MLSPTDWFRRNPTLVLAHGLSTQLIRGHLIGWHSGPQVPADFHIASPGDIILCHNPDGAYGYWTHAVLYVGHGQVADANDFTRGTILCPVDHYRNYDEVMLLRANVPSSVRRAAAEVAARKVGTPYDPLATLFDTHTAYCSKLIWLSYNKVGVSLCMPHNWVLPDDIATSPRLFCVASWTSPKQVPRTCHS